MINLFIPVSIAIILIFGRSILIPILVSIFFWYLINSLSSYYRKILPFKNKDNFYNILFNYISVILAILSFAGLLTLFITQIRPAFSEFLISLPNIEIKFNDFMNYIQNRFGFTLSFDKSLNTIISSIFTSVANLVASFGMIIIYIIFIFIEQSTFNKKLNVLIPNKTKFKKISFILNSIDQNMKKYLFMKTIISLITGVLSYIWLSYIGINFANVWGFIIFILGFIPTFGSIISTLLPSIYVLLMSQSTFNFILVFIGIGFLQVLFNNILEPKLTGKTLNLSTLAILINLVFWGTIWGTAGLFFSIPILVAIFIITAQFDSTRWISILLSADGNIPNKED